MKKNGMDGKNKQNTRGRSHGFSLIEVALALLVVGMGFASLLSFLPHGLRASRMTVEESAQNSFAQAVFGAIRVQSMQKRTRADWNAWINQIENAKQFQDLFQGLNARLDTAVWVGGPNGWDNNTAASNISLGTAAAPEFGVKSYYIRTQRSDDGLTYKVTLWSTTLETQNAVLVRNKGTCYFTEFKFMGP